MSTYIDYFLNSSPSVIEFDTFILSHSLFSQEYRIVRNSLEGLTAEGRVYTYYPVSVEPMSSRDDLEQSVKLVFGDLGTIVPVELDNIRDGDGFSEYPSLVYRTYRSDDLTSPLFGPISLVVTKFTFVKEGCAMVATAPRANHDRTGEQYTVSRFPMLKGLS